MKFHASLDGYSQTFDSLDALRTWANALVARYPYLIGKTLKIHKAVFAHTCRDGSGRLAVYSGKPSHFRQIVIGG